MSEEARAPHCVFYRIDSVLHPPSESIVLEIGPLNATIPLSLTEAMYFGVPAQKRHEPPTGWTAPLVKPHFMFWGVVGSATIGRHWHVANQFSDNMRLHLGKILGLLSPAGKQEGAQAPEVPSGFDHFAVVEVQGEGHESEVWVQDQFFASHAKQPDVVGRPRLLGVPATKILTDGTRFDATRSEELLVLYDLRRAPVAESRMVADQFVTGEVHMSRARWLATPTRMLDR